MHQHNFTLNDLDNMMPWEREIYVTMLVEFLEEEKKRQEENNKG